MSEIEQEAWKKYPQEDSDIEKLRNAFIEGANWQNEHPSIKSLYNFDERNMPDEELKEFYNATYNYYLDAMMELYKRKINI